MYKSHAFIGAGSPSHPDGDSHVNDMGIVQGHAYSVLALAEADGTKLIQLRNPHGRGEWQGDWSDDSDLWTNRMINLVNYQEEGDDGIFWMDFEDYVEEFDTTYVCRDFSKERGWQQ